MSKKKPIIGIVGAVGAGKSTVAAEFERLRCGVIRADVLNHEILNRSDIISQLKQWWSVSVIASDGKVDREAVSAIVLEDEKELKKLTDLVHPLIFQLQQEQIDAYQSDPDIKAIILDIPLLLEVKQEKLCDFLLFVRVKNEIRHQRLAKNRGWTTKKIKKIENLQINLDIKAKISEYIVENNSSIPETARQVSDILSLVREKTAG